jgi:iron complex outermembrane receptor protein
MSNVTGKWLTCSASAVAILASLCISGAAAAQSAAATETAEPNNRDDIVVTATRRDTLLQNTPAAISAFSNAALERSAIKNATDLAAFTPGLTASTNVGGTYAIRGISSDLLSISADSSVATYIDGVYLSRQTSNQIPFMDIERVEVLRGPQGTIYGRNATGGVISFVTKAPSETFNGTVVAELGNLDALQGNVMLTGPLVEDRVLFRVSASASRRDGYVTNVGPGGGKHNNEDYQSYRGKLLFKAAENFDLTLAGDYYRQRQEFPLDQLLILSDIGVSAGALQPTKKFQAAVNGDLVDTFDNRDLIGTSATMKWSPTPAMDVTSITAYRDTDTALFTDDDATTLYVSHTYIRERSKTFTQELYAQSSGEAKLNYLVGANFLSEKTRQDLTDSSAEADVYLPANARTRAWAVYGQLDYALTDRLKITAGVRYSHEHREMINAVLVDDRSGAGPVGVYQSPNRKASWNAITPNFLINFQVTDKTLLYALAARGFKSGGFASLGTAEEGFDPETVWNYEAGVKTSLWDGRARFNVAGFYADYSDLQRRVGTSLATLRLENAAAARIYGLEVEATLKPVSAWTISTAYSYLNAKYSDWETVLPGSTTPSNLSGFPLERSPKNKFSVVSNYVVPMRSGAVELTGGATYQSTMTFRSARGSAYEQKGFALLSASMTYRAEGDRWSLQVYGKNLTNKEYFLNKEGDPSAPALASGYSALPRTYGVRAQVNF